MRRDPRRWQTPFGRYIAQRGIRWVVGRLEAEGLPVTPFAVYHWLAADTAPRPVFAHALVRTSGGALTLDDVYEHRQQLERQAGQEGATCRST